MLIQHQWRRHSAFLLFLYLHDEMPDVLEKFCEWHCDDVVLRAVYQLAATKGLTTVLIEGERVKGQHKLIKTRHFLISD